MEKARIEAHNEEKSVLFSHESEQSFSYRNLMLVRKTDFSPLMGVGRGD